MSNIAHNTVEMQQESLELMTEGKSLVKVRSRFLFIARTLRGQFAIVQYLGWCRGYSDTKR